MLKLNLEALFKARGIRYPYTFLIKAGFSVQTATNLVHQKVKSLKFDQIEALCTALLCTPNDLFVYTPKAGQMNPSDFPLAQLQAPQHALDVVALTQNLSYQELKDFLKTVEEFKKHKEE